MKLMASLRLKYTAIPAEWENKKSDYIDFINTELGLQSQHRVKLEDISPSASGKNYIKSVMNIILGKTIVRLFSVIPNRLLINIIFNKENYFNSLIKLRQNIYLPEKN